MDPLQEALRATALSESMPRGARVLLAVSGGADSLALLHAAAELAPEADWTLAVAHVHHGWRGRDADRDLSFVAGHARRLGLVSLHRRVDARLAARELKLSPEAAARHVRYAALWEMALEAGAGRIATAHQKDDVLESHRIARERRSGPARLAGPRAARADGVVRPFLSVSREEILAFLSVRGLSYRRDSSNGSLRLARNRIRREIARERGRAGESDVAVAHEVIAAFGRERDRLDRAVGEEVRTRLFFGPGVTLADASWLAAAPQDLQRRAVEAAAIPFAAPGKPPLTGREREQVLERLAEGGDFRFEAGRSIRLERQGTVLRVRAVARKTRRV